MFAASNVDEIEFSINDDLKRIGSYCLTNELFLNLKPGKTEVMLFGKSQRLARHGRNLEITYQYNLINFVTEYVYLGNLVDNHLSLSSNFKRVYRKAYGRLRLLALVRRNLTMNAAELLYKMTILPILTYSLTVKTSFNKTQLLQFTSIERRASSIIGKPIDRISKTIEHNISTMVSKYVCNEFNHEIIILKLKIIGKQREMDWVLKWLKSNLKRRDLVFTLEG